MSIVGESTTLLRVLARRGLGAALVTVDAGLHPRRTARQGARLVQDVAAFVGVSGGPAATVTDAPTRGREAPPAPPTKSASPDSSTAPPAPEPERVVAEPAPPAPEEAADDSVPVEPSGPAPHLPPDIAAEVERDYAEDLPGFSGGEPPVAE